MSDDLPELTADQEAALEMTPRERFIENVIQVVEYQQSRPQPQYLSTKADRDQRVSQTAYQIMQILDNDPRIWLDGGYSQPMCLDHRELYAVVDNAEGVPLPPERIDGRLRHTLMDRLRYLRLEFTMPSNNTHNAREDDRYQYPED